MEARLLAFIGIAVILTITPGPDFALVTRVVLGRGRAAGWRTSLGVVTGHLLWGTASALGITALLHASLVLYTVLRFAGALYLIWLGAQALFARHTPVAATAPAHDVDRRAGSYRQGVVNDLLNPKIGVFYTTLLPQFIAPGQPVLLTSLLLTAIFASIVTLWLGLCVLLLARLGAFMQRAGVRQALERVTGAVLIGLGLRLATERS
jgi:threonine/homoserine/homoserine lactone efflux protein